MIPIRTALTMIALFMVGLVVGQLIGHRSAAASTLDVPQKPVSIRVVEPRTTPAPMPSVLSPKRAAARSYSV